MFSFGKSSGKTKTNQSTTSDVDPWDETIPYLKDFLSNLGGVNAANPVGATGNQRDAFDALMKNAKAGNPNTADIMNLAKDQFNTADNTGIVKDGYADLQRRLGATANGSNLDLANNTYLQKMLTQVGDDAQNRVNANFAAAGRDFSGANQQAVGRGVTQAQAPLLLDMFNKEQGRTDAASRDLFNAAGSTASQTAQLDTIRDALRSKGIDTTAKGLEAQDEGNNKVLNLEQQLKGLPYADLAQIANLLFPAAGLGQQGKGTMDGTSTTTKTSFGLDGGKLFAALGTLSDVRAKQDIERIGTLSDGLPLYRWRYIGGTELHIGPMAQDVGTLYPHAVRAGDDGLLRIDLDLATRNAATVARG